MTAFRAEKMVEIAESCLHKNIPLPIRKDWEKKTNVLTFSGYRMWNQH